MRLITIIRLGFILVGIVSFFFAYYDFAYADVISPFQGSANPETKMNSVFKDIIDYILYIAMGFAGIGIAWGLAELNGVVGDKKSGMDKIKVGAIVLATAGVTTAVIAKLSNMST